MKSSTRALLVSSLLACDPAGSTTTPETPQESEQQRRDQKVTEYKRAEYLKGLEYAQRRFEAEPSADNYKSYCEAVLRFQGQPPAVRDGIDIAPHEEQLLNGTGKQLIERLEADYAKKKPRTPELREALKTSYAERGELVYRRRPDLDFKADGIAALAIGFPDDDWRVGEGPWVTDLAFLDLVEEKLGRQAVHQACRAALDRALADDRRDKTRQHYVLEACVLDYGDWEADLGAWASAKETKEFRKAYAPIYAEGAAEVEARVAEREGKDRANARGSTGSGEPLVMLTNSCEHRINLVIGDDPASAGSRRLSLMVDEVAHEKIKADKRVWLVDDKKKVIAHATVSRYTTELEFTCTSVVYR